MSTRYIAFAPLTHLWIILKQMGDSVAGENRATAKTIYNRDVRKLFRQRQE